jgi:hypothetical protein
MPTSILPSPRRLEYAFRTDSYRIEVVFNPDRSWSYITNTVLTVAKIREPQPNPLAMIIAAKQRG